MQLKPILLLLVVLICFSHKSKGQNSSAVSKLLVLPKKLTAKMQKTTQSADVNLIKQTEKYLKHLAELEQNLHNRLQKSVSLKAREFIGIIQEKYQLSILKLNNPAVFFLQTGSGFQ